MAMKVNKQSVKKQPVKIDSTKVQDEYHALIAVWVLRMLLSSNPVFKNFFVYKRGFMDDDVRAFLQFSDKRETKIKVSDLKASMRSLLALYEQKVNTSATLFKNISLMSGRIKLSPIQQKTLALVVLKERYEPLKDFFESLHSPIEYYGYR